MIMYEGYDAPNGKTVTKLHKHRENAYIEMLEYLGVSSEYYQGELGLNSTVFVREVKK